LLKALALDALRAAGLDAAAEVRCPVPRFRADVAGASPEGSLPRRSVIIECKASRADIVRDAGSRASLAPTLARLECLRRRHRAGDGREIEPHLRRAGSALWPELDDWDWAASSSPASAAIDRALSRARRRLAHSTKLETVARWRLAGQLLLLTAPGVVRPGELPPGWGLLEARAPAGGLGANGNPRRWTTIVEVVAAPRHPGGGAAPPRERWWRALSRGIAAARRRAGETVQHDLVSGGLPWPAPAP
jgi:hypothetical protein